MSSIKTNIIQQLDATTGSVTLIHVASVGASYTNALFIGKVITDFAVWNNGDEQITVGNVDIVTGFDTVTGTFTFTVTLGNTYTIIEMVN